MSYLVFITIGIIVLVYIFRKQANYIPRYSHGWGTDYAAELGLTGKEKRILNYVSNEKKYDRFHYIDFYKFELANVYADALRKFASDHNTAKKYMSMFYFCDYSIKQRYSCKLPSSQEIVDFSLSLSDVEREEITLMGKKLRELKFDEEMKLYDEDSSRWNIFYDKLEEEYISADLFYEKLKILESLNHAISVKRGIYHKAYRFLIGKDRVLSLKLYMYYLSIKSESDTFKHYNISKSNQKILLPKDTERKRFEKIVADFKKDNDLEKALQQIDILFRLERRKIELDESAIKSARRDLSGVVTLLNEYLEDEEPSISAPPAVTEKENEATINSVQSEFIVHFIESGNQLSQQEIDIFANTKGVFKSQLVDELNEKFYDQLDDLLIEEDGEGNYIFNRSYYEQIKAG